MSSPLVLYGRSEDPSVELETQLFLFSDDNSTARIGGTVLESHGNVRVFVPGNRYLFDFLGETVRLSIVYNYTV